MPKLSSTIGSRRLRGSGQAPVVQKVDSAIHWINLYPVDSSIGFPNIYPLDSDLSSGQRYPPLTIILRGRAGYQVIRTRLVGYLSFDRIR